MSKFTLTFFALLSTALAIDAHHRMNTWMAIANHEHVKLEVEIAIENVLRNEELKRMKQENARSLERVNLQTRDLYERTRVIAGGWVQILQREKSCEEKEHEAAVSDGDLVSWLR